MSYETTNDYLARPLINGAAFAVETGHIKISCPSTIFAEARRITPLNKGEILALYAEALSNAKKHNAKISYKNRYRKKINDYWSEYEAACTRSHKLFADIVNQAEIVQSRGIHYGTSDDDELKKLQQMTWDHQKFLHRDTVISLITDICWSLEKLKSSFSSDREILTVYL